MTSKKTSASAKKELRTTIKKLRSKLDRADQAAHRLKSRTARLTKANTELEAQVKDLNKSNKRLKKALRPTDPKPAVAKDPSVATQAPATTVNSPTVHPDTGWTVAQLRAEARSRGLTGLSRKTKADLLAALG